MASKNSLNLFFFPSLVFITAPSHHCRYFTAVYSRALPRCETQSAETQMPKISTMTPRPTAFPPATEDLRSPAAKGGEGIK